MALTTEVAAASTMDGPLTEAGRFLDALLTRDFVALARCLEPDVRFRALVPKGLLERQGPEETAGQLQTWFGTEETLEVVDATLGQVGPRLYLRWHLRLTAPDGTVREVEQHAFVTVSRRIALMDLLCCGFFPADSRTASKEISP